MPRKYDLMVGLYQHTIDSLTETPERWCNFLRSAAFQYKYPFPDQVMIYAQRPEATACAELELWNKYFDRWVNTGAKGIALFSQKQTYSGLRHVFDVADTHGRHGEPLEIWQLTDGSLSDIVDSLENTYGELKDKTSFWKSVKSACENITQDNITDYLGELPGLKDGSALEGLHGDELAETFETILTASVTYSVLTRLGANADFFVDMDAFNALVLFDKPEVINLLGTASGDISEMMLRQIEKTVKASEKEIRTFDGNKENGYNIGENQKSQTGGKDYGTERTDLPQRQGWDDVSRSESSGADALPDREIRRPSVAVSEGTQESDLYDASDAMQTERAPSRDRNAGESENVGNHDEARREQSGERGTESRGSDALGGGDEQHQSGSGRNGSDGTDLRLKTKLPDCMPDVLIQALRHGNYLAKSKEEIVSFLRSEKNEDKKNEFVKGLYTEGLVAEFYKPGTKETIGYQPTKDGFIIFDGAYQNRTAESMFSWDLTRSLIEALVSDKNYLDEPVQKEAVQVNLFGEPVEEKNGKTVPVEVPKTQFAVSQEVVDAFLRLGSATKGSTQRIYSWYRRANDSAENVEFLKWEYEKDSVGLIVGDRKVAARWDKDGVTIAEGESVDEAENTVFLPWQAVDKRIRVLLESGQYISDSEAEKADEVWNNHAGEYITYLYWDYFDNIPSEYKPCAMMDKRLFPDLKEHLLAQLNDPERRDKLIAEIEGNVARLDEYPPRFSGYRFTAEQVLMLAKSYSRDPVDFPKAGEAILPPEHYLSQDKIDDFLTHYGSGIESGKFRIYSYFLQEKDLQKRASFLSNEYGIGGGSGGRTSNSHDSKGLSIGGGLETYGQGVLFKWPQVARRIDRLISEDRYLNEKEQNSLDDYEKNIITSKVFAFFSSKPVDAQRPVPIVSFYPSDDEKKVVTDMLSDPQKLSELIEIMQAGFDTEMPGSRHYDFDAECLKAVKSYADGTFNLFPDSTYREKKVPVLAEPEPQKSEKEPVDEPKNEEKPSFDEYDIHLGTDVYIGSTECSVTSLEGDRVELFDGSLIPLEMDKATFYRRISENPLNDRLKKQKETEQAGEEKKITMTRIGDFYEFFGEDAKVTAEVLGLTLTSRLMPDGKRVPMTGIPYHVQGNYIKKLIEAGYKVEIHETLNPDKPKVVEPPNEQSDEPNLSDHIFIDTDNEQVTWIAFNPASDAGGEYQFYQLSFENYKEAFDYFVKRERDWNDKDDRDDFLDEITDMADCEFAPKTLPSAFTQMKATYHETPDYDGFSTENFQKIYKQIENYEADKEAQRAGDEYETEFGADGYRMFPGNEPDIPVFGRETEILYDILNCLKIDDIELSFDENGLVAKDADTTWHGGEFYDFLVNEALVYEDDGSVLGVGEELLEDFKELAAHNGYPLPMKDTLEKLPEMVEVPKPKRVQTTFDAFPGVPMEWRLNYEIDDDNLGVGTPEDRYYANVQAIRLLKKLEAENRHAQDDEQRALAKYVGWGGLASCFEEGNKHYEELKDLLTEEEYNAARESTLTAFFTPPTVIRAIYQAIENMGFKRGNILEPSCGVGNFIGMKPKTLEDAKFYGVELDSISGRIARQLYQKSSITISGFENTMFPDSFFDVAIGNVPFGQFKVSDKKYDKNNFLIHDYFFAKALDKVRPGGIVAFITSHGTLDKENPAVRKYIAERADFLGAIRLPNDTFKYAAGTEVTSDIIFLQKRDRIIETEPDWIHLGTDENGIKMNQYFIDNSEMVMGEMVMQSGPFGPEATCRAYDGQDLGEQLTEAISNIHANYTEIEADELTGEEEDNTIPADPNVKNFSYTLLDGKVYYRENSIMKPVDTSMTGENRIKGMIGIRDTVRELIDAQLYDEPDSKIKELQIALNRKYDEFTKKYGLINSRGNASVFDDDNSYFLLCSLAKLDEEGNLKEKADIFTKRTIKPQRVLDKADTASEALALSIGEHACVDMAYMSELTGKSEEELYNDLKGVIFLNPLYGYGGKESDQKYLMADEYLSGNVRQKLEWAIRSAEQNPEDFTVNVEALKEVQPKDLTAAEIGVRLGSTWIPPEDIQTFMYELLGTPYYYKYRMQVKFEPHTAQWTVTEKSFDRGNVKANSVYGTSRINAYSIIEDSLNLKDVRVVDYVEDENGNKKPILNKKETAIAQGKQEEIKRKFEEWIWKDPARRERLCKLYNEKFNSVRPREYNGEHIKFFGMTPEITLRDHQKNAVARIIYGGNSLLAHVVGAGKTFTMVAAAQEEKRLGLCNKSMFVVPNHLISQWASEYLQLYPSANILVATKKDFETKNRKKFCARIATGDYDAVIIGHSQFEKIPLSVERQIALIQDEINEILESIDKLKYERGERFTVKQLEKTKKQLQQKMDKLNDRSRKDDVVTFEQLGVDRLFIDEAHFYKNLAAYTKMRNVAGIAQTEAQKSSDLYGKCRYLDELTGGKGVTFATGTPISNTMVELYTMQKYLQYEEMKLKGLTNFDAWASTFGETVTAIELAPDGSGYRAKTRFAKFFNIPELMAMFKQVADVQTADMLNLPVPKANFHIVKVAATDIQKEMVQSFAERAARVHAGIVKSDEDNMLLITNDGRKTALDQRLMNPALPDDPQSKVNACAENVFDIWERTAENRSTQMVFCDLSTPKSDGTFSVYNDIRDKLIARGVPAEEIAFIHDADTDAKKKDLFSKVRSGQVRVLLGSTFKMGAGTNVQDKLIAIHDLDCPWRPSDLEQRLGRIVRQGNGNPEVEIFRYVTEGTFDAYMYQLLESKQKFISQVMTSKSPVRSAEDVDETALSYAEIKALATGNPLIMEKMQLDADVAKLKLQKASHLSQRYQLEDKLLKEYPKQIRETEERIAGLEADIVTAEENTHENEKGFSPMVIFGDTFTVKADAGKTILEICKRITKPEPKPIGEYRGFGMNLGFDPLAHEFFINLKGKLTHRVLLGQDANGIITRLDNAIEALPTRRDTVKEQLVEIHKQVENAEQEVKAPFAREAELEEKSKRLDVLNAELNMDKKENELVDDEQEAEEGTRTKAQPEREEEEER